MTGVPEMATSEEKKWEIEGAASTLVEAEKIKLRMKKDKTFGKAVRAELKVRTSAIQQAAKQ